MTTKKAVNKKLVLRLNRHWDLDERKRKEMNLGKCNSDDVQDAVVAVLKNDPEIQDSVEWQNYTKKAVGNKHKENNRKKLAQKRGGGEVRSEGVFVQSGKNDENLDSLQNQSKNWNKWIQEPPDDAAMASEWWERWELFLKLLPDDTYRTIARMRYAENCTYKKIAEKLNLNEGTISRRDRNVIQQMYREKMEAKR